MKKIKTYKHFEVKSKNSLPKKLISIVVLFLALCAIVAGLYYWLAIRDNNTATIDKNSDDPTIGSAKKSGAKVSETKPGGSITTSDQVPVDEALSIGSINLTQQDGTVSASAQIIGSDQEGVCVFSYTSPDSRPVVKESNGVTICSTKAPENEFDKIGEWNLTVTYYVGGSKASTSKKVMIN